MQKFRNAAAERRNSDMQECRNSEMQLQSAEIQTCRNAEIQKCSCRVQKFRHAEMQECSSALWSLGPRPRLAAVWPRLVAKPAPISGARRLIWFIITRRRQARHFRRRATSVPAEGPACGLDFSPPSSAGAEVRRSRTFGAASEVCFRSARGM